MSEGSPHLDFPLDTLCKVFDSGDRKTPKETYAGIGFIPVGVFFPTPPEFKHFNGDLNEFSAYTKGHAKLPLCCPIVLCIQLPNPRGPGVDS